MGLRKLPDVQNHLNGLWDYATTKWLKLTLPNPEDRTRARWPIHPLWSYLSSVDWEGDGGVLTRTFSPARVPSDDKLFSIGLSTLVSFMAKESIGDFAEGFQAYASGLRNHYMRNAARAGMTFGVFIAAADSPSFSPRADPPETHPIRVTSNAYGDPTRVSC